MVFLSMRGKQCQNLATRHLSRRVTTSSGGGVRTELEGAETVWREDLNGTGGGINVASEDALFYVGGGFMLYFLLWRSHCSRIGIGIVELFLCWSRYSSLFVRMFSPVTCSRILALFTPHTYVVGGLGYYAITYSWHGIHQGKELTLLLVCSLLWRQPPYMEV